MCDLKEIEEITENTFDGGIEICQEERDKLNLALQSYMRKKVLKRRIDEQKNHVRNSFASEQKYQKERIEELEQQLKAENHNE